MKVKTVSLLAGLALALLILFPIAVPVVAQPEAEYTISHYEATFELVPDSAGELCDVAVTLVVTYDVTSGQVQRVQIHRHAAGQRRLGH